jgi:hypothetical protein
MWRVSNGSRSRFATQSNAKAFVLELQLREPVIAQQRD